MSEEENIIRRVSNLLATAFLYSGSPNLIDRFANALSKEAISKVLYDVQRVVQVGIDNSEIKNEKVKTEKGEDFRVIKISHEGTEYTIFGSLPSDHDIEEFLSMIERNVYYARKAGALAMATVNKVKFSKGEKE